MRKVSIIIPAYNEEAFIGRLIEKIRTVEIGSIGFEMEIIVVDDGSCDSTADIVRNLNIKNLRLIQQKNQGKGRAVQHGIKEASGQYILIQDADLEYEPNDYTLMLKELSNSEVSVYGSRVLGQYRKYGKKLPFPGRHQHQDLGPWLAGIILSWWAFILYGKWITDTLTGYKVYPRDVIRNMHIKTHGFETDHEITAKLIRKGIRIVEVPVEYHPRTLEEGKKIKFSDGLKAVWTLFKYRWVN